MPTYAILGATGNIGSQLLTNLASNPSNQINAYVRSAPKLKKLLPTQTSQPNVHIYEGALSPSTIAPCIRNTSAVFLAVAAMSPIPDCSIAQDTARTVIVALQQLRDEDPHARMPRLIVLSSASITEKFYTDIPYLIHQLLLTALWSIYSDLIEAEKFLRAHAETDGLIITYMKPGGISHDIARGYALSEEGSHTFMSYADVAAGMVGIAGDETEERWDGKDVSVVPPPGGRGAKFEWLAPLSVFKGLAIYYVPALYPYIG